MEGGEKRSKMRIEADTFRCSILNAYVLCYECGSECECEKEVDGQKKSRNKLLAETDKQRTADD